MITNSRHGPALLTILGLLLLTAPLSGQQGERELERPQRIESLPFEGSYQEVFDAIRRLEARLEEHPQDHRSRMDLGRKYFRLASDGNLAALKKAEEVFEELLAAGQFRAEATAYKAFLIGMGVGFGVTPASQRERAIQLNHQLLDEAVALKPDSLEVRLLRAYDGIYTPQRYQRSQLAIRDFERVLQLAKEQQRQDIRPARIQVFIGDLYLKMNDWAAAQQHYRQAVEIAPSTLAALSAQTRLKSLEERFSAESSTSLRPVISLLGFLSGTVLFVILAGMLVRELLQLRQRRAGAGAALAVSLLALSWNAFNLVQVLTETLGLPFAQSPLLAQWHQQDGFLWAALAPIPIGLISAYRLHKATFMDIVLKRGAALCTIFLLSLLNSRLVEAPLSHYFVNASHPALRTFFFTGIWIWIFMLYALLRDRIYRLIDRHVFRRRDHSQLLDQFHIKLSSLTSVAQLQPAVSTALREAFFCDPVLFLEGDDPLSQRLQSEMGGQGKSVLLRSEVGDDALFGELEGRPAELALKAQPGQGEPLVVLLGPRNLGQSYLSEELAVLRALAAQLGRTLENLRLQEQTRRQAVRQEELEKLASMAQLRALRAQIDPHFFFNSLNSLAQLTAEDPQAAERLTEDLAELFRKRFQALEDLIPLDEELELVETYLRVEKVRLGDRLEVHRSIDPGLGSTAVPVLSIQPLVENAVRHGVGGSAQPGCIRLQVEQRGDKVRVTVSDSGKGLGGQKADQILTNGVGLSNVDARLRTLYGESWGVRCEEGAQGGAVFWFEVPCSKAAPQEMEAAS